MFHRTILILSLFLSLSLHAQRFHSGLCAGISTTQIDGDSYAGFHKAGPFAGVFVNTPFNEKWDGQFEINYIQKGSKDPPDPDNGVFDFYTIRLNYIEIPVLVRWHHNNLFFELGASYGRLFSESQEDIRGKLLDAQKVLFPFKKNEIAYQLGASYHVTDQLIVSWRNSASILPVADQSYFNKWLLRMVGGSYNLAIYFTLRYQFKTADE